MARLTTRLTLAWARRRAKRRPPPPFEPLPRDTKARILVVNTTGIGDTIFCTAPIADLRESFANAHIAAFVDRRRVDLLRGNPRLNEIIIYPGKFKKLIATARALARGAFDVAIIQHANDPDVVPLVARAKPRFIVGYASHTFSDLYSVKLPPADREGGAHTIDARLALTRAVGGAGRHWHMELYPSAEDRALAAHALADAGLTPGQAIALNLGGALPGKRWPPDRWAELAHELNARGLPVVFVGGPADVITGELVRERLGADVRCAFLVGKLPLRISIALLQLCRAHITPDSGLLHAGLALDVPTVALFGPDDPRWTGPHPNQARAEVVRAEQAAGVAQHDRREDTDGALMRSIEPSRVLAALGRAIR